MLRDPQTVRIETPDERFDETMDAIRSWLRNEGVQLSEFKVGPADTGFEIELGFRTTEEAERFRRRVAAETETTVR